MIPYISLLRRMVAWLIWRYEGYESVDDAEFYIIKNPGMTRLASLMRDYWYVKRAGDE